MTKIPALPHQVVKADKIEETFKDCIDLAVSKRGGKVLTVTDEWFAEAQNLLSAHAPVSRPHHFVPSGAWFDGWQTRRHNAHYDWCVIELAHPGTIEGFEVDTAFLTGNHAPFVSIEGFKDTSNACKTKPRSHEQWAAVEWVPLLAKSALEANVRHGYKFDKPSEEAFTHVRVCMYPDGGLSRVRVYGHLQTIYPENKHEMYDLAAVSSGSTVTEFSDAHYGHPSNMLLPGRGHDMSDGWETRRSRTPGHVDFAVIKLGRPGHVAAIEVDTAHYKGNAPKAVSIAGFEIGSDEPIMLLDQKPVLPHRQNFFEIASDLTERRVATIRVIMIPDGGIKRVRIWGSAQLPAVQPEDSLIGVRQELEDENTWSIRKHEPVARA
ncbi:Allantoicase [Mortierella hygrophila]|uniref:Allantoicase n=1 Tax=Mortierella hygrophila TaxID=979708 RepID=A0A9P6FC93_9FUNG|nr:Allantoicase [Mortierella hygrophila]